MSEKHEMPANPPNKVDSTGPGYETTDVGGGFVPVFAVVVIVGALLLLPGLWWMLTAFLARLQARQPAVSPLAVTENDRLPAQPRLEGIESPDLARKRQAANENILHSYGWVNQQEQIVRIPIDRAMDIAAGTLHGVSKKENGPSPNEFEMPRSSNSGRMMKVKEVSP
jgi:hypothetical protein